MKYYLKLNTLALIYGFNAFILSELWVNTYRIARIANLDIETTNLIIKVSALVIFIFSSLLFFLITKKHFNTGHKRYYLMFLWFPYTILFVLLFGLLSPIKNPAEMPLPGIGIVIIMGYLLYPIYIAIINLISTKK